MAEESPQVRALKERYQQSLAEKSQTLGELIDRLASNKHQGMADIEAGDGDSIADYLHRLAGSAGMYGYDDIAQLARTAIADQRQGETDYLATNLAELRSLLDQYSSS